MPLQNFIDNSLPTIKAAWLNSLDAFYTTLFNSATTPAAARTALGSTTVGDAVFIAADQAAARTTLGALAASAVSAYAITLLDDPDAATARATLGLTIGTHVPAPTGAGASGTWSINITGNAATASNGGVTSVNGMTGAVSVTTGVSSLNGQTGAITNTSQDAVGAVEALLYAIIGAAITAGTTYAGSSLRRGFTATLGQNAFDSNSSISGSACSGTWRCMAGVAAVGGQYPVALFVRVS